MEEKASNYDLAPALRVRGASHHQPGGATVPGLAATFIAVSPPVYAFFAVTVVY